MGPAWETAGKETGRKRQAQAVDLGRPLKGGWAVLSWCQDQWAGPVGGQGVPPEGPDLN